MTTLAQALEKYGLSTEYDAIHAKFAGIENSDANRMALEKDIIDSHMYYLLKKDAVLMQQRKHLLYCWHEDRKEQFTPAMTFIDERLGSGHCQRLIDICYDRVKPGTELPTPASANPAAPQVPTENEMIQKMMHKAAYAPTYCERFFYKSLISWMKDTGSYAKLVEEIQQSPAKFIALLVPITGSFYCATVFAPALLFGLSLTAFLSKASDKMAQSPNSNHQQIAGTVKTASNQAYYVIVSLPAIVSSANFILAQSTLTFIQATMRYIAHEENTPSANNNQPAIESIALQIIASHISNYIAEQSTQKFANYREGASKSLILKTVVNQIEVISKKTATLAEKLDEVERLLIVAAAEPIIKDSGKNASAALACAKMELDLARKTLTNVDMFHYYNVFHGAMLPLQEYLAEYQKQWIASWRANAEVAGAIKKAVTAISEASEHAQSDVKTSIHHIKTTLDLLHMDAVRLHADRVAMQAIEKSQAAFAEQCAAPRASMAS